MSFVRGRQPLSLEFWCLCILLLVAAAFGGGGRSAPLANLVVQLVAIGCLAISVSGVRQFLASTPILLRVLVGSSLALPLLHSIPLPPSVWQVLPGRDLIVESLQLVEGSLGWMPLSIDPSLSLLAFVGLLPPFAILVLAGNIKEGDKARILTLLIGCALLVLCVGAVQLASGGVALDFYAGGSSNRLAGSFANHNTAGLFFVVILCLLLSAQSEELGGFLGLPSVKYSLAAIFVVAVLLTQSRSSIALLAVPFCIVLYRLGVLSSSMSRSRGIGLGLVTLVTLLTLAGVAFSNERFGQAISRFESFEDLRPAIWSDGMVSAERFWPVGSGMGTFDEVFQVDESLENVTIHRAGRAHNDYLEIVIESGVIGPILLLFWIAYLSRQVVLRSRASGSMMVLGSGAGLLCIAAQSLLDYPLRNQTFLCIAALLVVFLNGGAKKVSEEVRGA